MLIIILPVSLCFPCFYSYHLILFSSLNTAMNQGRKKKIHLIFYVFSAHLQCSNESVKSPKAQHKGSKVDAEKLSQQLKDLTRKWHNSVAGQSRSNSEFNNADRDAHPDCAVQLELDLVLDCLRNVTPGYSSTPRALQSITNSSPDFAMLLLPLILLLLILHTCFSLPFIQCYVEIPHRSHSHLLLLTCLLILLLSYLQ